MNKEENLYYKHRIHLRESKGEKGVRRGRERAINSNASNVLPGSQK